MKLTLKIQDRVGQIRTVRSQGETMMLGEGSGHPGAVLSKRDNTFWLESIDAANPVRLGDQKIVSGEFLFGPTLTIGNLSIQVERETDADSDFTESTGWLTQAPIGRQMLELSKRAARTPLTIYLEGETGTGKEVLARQIHEWSLLAGGPFIALNCGALSASLAESELFGHIRGSFTGAVRDRTGACLKAHQGTLFLDEIGDLSADLQVKLLRFLESGEVRPVGSDQVLKAKARILCATHKPLGRLVEDGKFRRDLYFRLASVVIKLPSLNDRPEDIPFLAQRFAHEFKKTLTQSALDRLLRHPWSGNVRELRHAIERAATLSITDRPSLFAEDFEFISHGLQDEFTQNSSDEIHPDRLLTLKEMERKMLLKALKRARGHRGVAAELLGIARSTLFEMLKRHQVVSPRTIEILADEAS